MKKPPKKPPSFLVKRFPLKPLSLPRVKRRHLPRLSVPSPREATLAAFPASQRPAVSACVRLLAEEGLSLPFVARYRAETLGRELGTSGNFGASEAVKVGEVWKKKVEVYKMKRKFLRRAKKIPPKLQRLLMDVDTEMEVLVSAGVGNLGEEEEERLEEYAEVVGNVVGNFLYLISVSDAPEVPDRYGRFRERLVDVKSFEFFAVRRFRCFRVDLEPQGFEYWRQRIGEGLRDGGFDEDAVEEVEEAWEKVMKRVKRRKWKEVRERAEEELVEVFKKNVREKLELESPKEVQRRKREGEEGLKVMAIDPGQKHGNKISLVQNKLVGESVVVEVCTLRDVVSEIYPYIIRIEPDVIVVGNGLSGKEVFNEILALCNVNNAPAHLRNILLGMIDESGSSHYSVSEQAESELSEFPIIHRSAITLARRVLDPLGEFVKVDPECLSVGLYQKDLRRDKLISALHSVVQEVVLDAGADLNTVSTSVLERIPGVSASLARNIALYRSIHPFRTRAELLDVMDIDHRAFTNLAGFVRVFNGPEPLDQTSIHPEQYMEICGAEFPIRETPKPKPEVCELRTASEWKFADRKFPDSGMVEGVVRNVVEFGVFVDVGDGDGLLHRSEFSPDKTDFRIGEKIRVRVLPERVPGKISLSMKSIN